MKVFERQRETEIKKMRVLVSWFIPQNVFKRSGLGQAKPKTKLNPGLPNKKVSLPYRVYRGRQVESEMEPELKSRYFDTGLRYHQ